MRIAICDEDREQREELVQRIRTCLAGGPISYQLREYTRADGLLYDVQDGEGADLIFLDVSMEGGWETAQALYCMAYDGDVILLSACGEHAVAGYAVEADGFLLKPYSTDAVDELIRRLCTRVHKACLTVSYHRHIVRIPYHELLYIESRNAKCLIHRTGGKEYVSYAHLDALEEQLCDRRFLRCHQSFLVNMDHIVGADRQFLLSNGDAVLIRQRERQRIRQRYLDYLQLIGGSPEL